MAVVRSTFLLLLWLSVAGGAAAQPWGEVLVVPYGDPDLETAVSAAAALEAQLSSERISLIAQGDARNRLTASRPPQTASDEDRSAIARGADAALEHVAFGRIAEAQKSAHEVLDRAERGLEAINRDPSTARHVLDACLSLVRAALQSSDRARAREQAMQCRLLVPDLMPSEAAHPANVMGALREVDNLLRAKHIGRLTVTSTPTACALYLNGRPQGATPVVLEHAAPGEYRVQVECDRSAARVHLVQLGDQAATIHVEPPLERAVSTEPRLSLRYTNESTAREQAPAHAGQLGSEAGASDVIVVHVRSGYAELLRVEAKQQRLVGRAVVPWTASQGFSRTALKQALAALADRDHGEPAGYREAIEDAVSEMANHRYDEALALFTRAHQLSPSARTHRGMGFAEFELRNYEASIDQLEAALSSTVKPLERDLRSETERLLQRARTYVGEVVVRSQPATQEVLVDESFVRPADVPIRLAAGAHVLDLKIPGYAVVRRHVQVRGGERQTLRIELAPPTHANPREERHWYKSPWLWTAVGVAAAGAAVGVALAARNPGTRTGEGYGGSTGVTTFGPGRAP